MTLKQYGSVLSKCSVNVYRVIFCITCRLLFLDCFLFFFLGNDSSLTLHIYTTCFALIPECRPCRNISFNGFSAAAWPEITDKWRLIRFLMRPTNLFYETKMADIIRYSITDNIKSMRTMKYGMICMFHTSTNSIAYLKI
jgi:hypothetical protein